MTATASHLVTHATRMKRSDYAGAAGGRLNKTWRVTNASADASIRSSLMTLRARSRSLARDNDYMRRFMSLVRNNVIGPQGVTLQVRATNPDGSQDTPANLYIEGAWDAWAKKGVCDVSGMLSLRMLQNSLLDCVVRDGEILLRRVKGWTGNKDGYALQVLDPDLLDETYTGLTPDGREIRMGVEYDPWMKPVGYWLRKRHRNDLPGTSGVDRSPFTRERVPADQILHCFIMERPWQSRGVPWCVSGMQRMRHLDGYEEAEIIGKRVSASKMGFFERNPEGQGYMGPKLEEGEGDDGAIEMEAEPGTFETLPYGVKLNTFDPKGDGTSYKDFVKATLRGISAGLCVSYNSLANDLEGVNYSSIRAGVLEEREVWQSLQAWIIETVLEFIFADWLALHMLNNSTLPLSKFAKFNVPQFTARRWQWVDPMKDTEAAALAVAQRFKSRGDVIRESGRDPETVWAEIAAENKTLAKLEILPDNPPKPPPAATPPPADQSEAGDG